MQTARPVTKPTKQRKMIYEAPAHIRHKLFAAHLSPELRATHLVRSFPVRSGDTIRVTRGDHKGFEGKISRVDLRKYRVYLEGLTREKVDGTTVFVAVHPSKVIITRLNLDDKWRKKVLERKQKTQAKPKETRKKAKPEIVQKHAETVEVKKPPEAELEKEVEVERPPEVEVKKPSEEKELIAKRSAKKTAAKPRRKQTKAAAVKETAQAEETKEETKPKVKKKRAGRKSTKKTEDGEE
jgi:large subunit ribosomal protein L24